MEYESKVSIIVKCNHPTQKCQLLGHNFVVIVDFRYEISRREPERDCRRRTGS